MRLTDLLLMAKKRRYAKEPPPPPRPPITDPTEKLEKKVLQHTRGHGPGQKIFTIVGFCGVTYVYFLWDTGQLKFDMFNPAAYLEKRRDDRKAEELKKKQNEQLSSDN